MKYVVWHNQKSEWGDCSFAVLEDGPLMVRTLRLQGVRRDGAGTVLLSAFRVVTVNRWGWLEDQLGAEIAFMMPSKSRIVQNIERNNDLLRAQLGRETQRPLLGTRR